MSRSGSLVVGLEDGICFGVGSNFLLLNLPRCEQAVLCASAATAQNELFCHTLHSILYGLYHKELHSLKL